MNTAMLSREARRIAALRSLGVLDTLPEPAFDAVTATAAQLCGAPIALISLVDAQRQWFKSNVGLPGTPETPRDVAFCDHAIRDDALFEVPTPRTTPASPTTRWSPASPTCASTPARRS